MYTIRSKEFSKSLNSLFVMRQKRCNNISDKKCARKLKDRPRQKFLPIANCSILGHIFGEVAICNTVLVVKTSLDFAEMALGYCIFFIGILKLRLLLTDDL